MTNECEIHNDKIVSWTIKKDNIESTLIGETNENGKIIKPGLLFINNESAGKIDFEDHSCHINKKHHVCNKQMNLGLNFKNGKTDSVMTPLSVVNFHTHPLNCYIQAKTIWGWPSGEDLARCIEFANNNNLTHIIFAVEGTYIIDVNKELLADINQKVLTDILIHNIEIIFQLTHKHRMYENDKDIELEDEFYQFFLKPLKISEKRNILYSWISLVNNLSIKSLLILTRQFSNDSFKELGLKNMENMKLSNSLLNEKIYNISFVQNKSIQFKYKSNTPDEKIYLFNKMSKGSINYKTKLIKLPNVIKYKAAFISQQCKLID